MQSKTIAVDLAKSVFQVTFADENQRITERRRLSRPQFQRLITQSSPSRIVMEGCASAHHWGRLAIAHGHEPKLLHAKYVAAYVRRNKTDAADADALLRADGDDTLVPIAVKSVDQQALQSLHAIRAQWRGTLTAQINQAKALLAEFGLIVPRGSHTLGQRLHHAMLDLPDLLQPAFTELIFEINQLTQRIDKIDQQFKTITQTNAEAKRLTTIAGVGPLIATAMVARVPDIHGFRRGRSFASWLGITPREFSSGSKRRLGSISLQGDVYLRTLLIHGARAALLACRRNEKAGKPLTQLQRWALATQARVGHNKATVALANKMARIIWAVWTRKTTFNGDDALRFN